jgi:hypothetical protein
MSDRKEPSMNADANVRVVLEVFAAIERRDTARFLAHTHPECTICWPPPTGLCFDGQVLGLYQVRQERLARAQMFYFDTDAANRFLADATGQRPPSPPSKPPTAGR